jgi:hypothetical protein
VGVTNEVAAQLGALVVQAELGDHDAQRHAPGYVDRITLVPNQASPTVRQTMLRNNIIN